MEYQTRSETTGLMQHKTLKDALIAANKDKTIWKLSFNAEDGSRIRLVRNSEDEWELSLMSLEFPANREIREGDIPK